MEELRNFTLADLYERLTWDDIRFDIRMNSEQPELCFCHTCLILCGEQNSMVQTCFSLVVSNIRDINKVKNLYEEYSPNRWEYNVNCRLRFPSQRTVDNHNQKGRCLVDGAKKPATCFQEPIHYNYTWNTELASFPDEFAVIQRFPKCWSKLGPLLCGTIYRPCNLKTLFKHAAGNIELTDITTDELWQVFYPDFCQNAAKDCSFLEELQLWPSFLRCSDQVPAQLIPTVPEGTQAAELKLFNPSCKVGGLCAISQSAQKYQCLWPLVHVKSQEGMNARPLMDECFMPCRSPLLATQSAFDYFYYLAAVLCVVSFSIYIYLAWLSQIYIDHFEVFLLSKALLSAAIYYLLMFIPSIKYFFEAAICTNGGIRNEVGRIGFGSLHGWQALFHPCNLGGGQLLFLSITSYAWIIAFLLHHLLFGSHPSEADYKVKLTDPSSPTVISSRTLHSVLIYMLSAIYTLLVLLLSQVPVEARLGICHYANGNTYTPLYLHLPTIVLLLVLIFVSIGVAVDKAKGILLILVLLSSGAMLAVYIFWQRHDETEMIRQSVFCSLQATISKKNASLDWMQHSSWNEDMVFSLSSVTDPYIRRQNLQRHISAPGCSLPVEEDWIYLFVSLLVLPSLPFLLIFLWFLSGSAKE